jgi:hypothetical protein
VIRFGYWFDRLTEQEICFPCNLLQTGECGEEISHSYEGM